MSELQVIPTEVVKVAFTSVSDFDFTAHLFYTDGRKRAYKLQAKEWGLVYNTLLDMGWQRNDITWLTKTTYILERPTNA